MDSKKSDNDARIKIFEAIENLCHSKDISAKEIAQILYESFSIKSDFFPNDVLNVFSTLSNSDCKYNDEEIKRIIYNHAKNMHLSLLQSINNAQPITDDRDKDSDVESLSLQSTGDQSTSENLSEKNCIVSDKDSEYLHAATESNDEDNASEGSSHPQIDLAEKFGVPCGVPFDDDDNDEFLHAAAESDDEDNASEGSSHPQIDLAEKFGVPFDDDEPDDKSDSNSANPKEKKSPRKQPSIITLERKLTSKTPFIVRNGLVYHYDNEANYYKLVDQDDVIKLYRYHIDPKLNKSPNLRNYNDLYRCIKTDPWLERDEDLGKETCCPLQNGLYFINKIDGIRQFDHNPIFLTFTCLNASYNKDATCKVFKKFIKDTTGGREDLKKRLLMALGYLLVNTTRGKFFFLAGFKPNTGKSVLFNFIQRLYPPESVSNLPVGDLGGRFESEALLHSRINISLDLPQEPLSASAVAKLKQITGGDTVEVQRKGKTSKKLDHPVKLVFASNSRLRLKKDDTAFWNRLIYLPFENTVTEEDPDLSEKLWNERDGIVTYLLKYALKLEELDYKFPHIPEDDTKVSVERCAIDYLPGFINACCELGKKFFCPTSAMRKAYEDYCYDNFIPVCSSTEFNTFMKSINIPPKQQCYPRSSDKQVRGFKGIRLRQSGFSLDNLI